MNSAKVINHDGSKPRKTADNTIINDKNGSILTGKVKKLTRKQKHFADLLINNPKMSATKSAEQSYNLKNNNVARAVASENLTKPSILAYMQEHLPKAEHKIIELIDSDREDIALRASQDVINRINGLPVAKVETTSKLLSVNIDLTSSDSELNSDAF